MNALTLLEIISATANPNPKNVAEYKSYNDSNNKIVIEEVRNEEKSVIGKLDEFLNIGLDLGLVTLSLDIDGKTKRIEIPYSLFDDYLKSKYNLSEDDISDLKSSYDKLNSRLKRMEGSISKKENMPDDLINQINKLNEDLKIYNLSLRDLFEDVAELKAERDQGIIFKEQYIPSEAEEEINWEEIENPNIITSSKTGNNVDPLKDMSLYTSVQVKIGNYKKFVDLLEYKAATEGLGLLVSAEGPNAEAYLRGSHLQDKDGYKHKRTNISGGFEWTPGLDLGDIILRLDLGVDGEYNKIEDEEYAFSDVLGIETLTSGELNKHQAKLLLGLKTDIGNIYFKGGYGIVLDGKSSLIVDSETKQLQGGSTINSHNSITDSKFSGNEFRIVGGYNNGIVSAELNYVKGNEDHNILEIHEGTTNPNPHLEYTKLGGKIRITIPPKHIFFEMGAERYSLDNIANQPSKIIRAGESNVEFVEIGAGFNY
ncbi:hypothetical protein JW949_01230 [Candidatus Woesearchaeota archaeon]|nr:hypothetical protein [Candidatus Woesearchaeota archaeon]